MRLQDYPEQELKDLLDCVERSMINSERIALALLNWPLRIKDAIVARERDDAMQRYAQEMSDELWKDEAKHFGGIERIYFNDEVD